MTRAERSPTDETRPTNPSECIAALAAADAVAVPGIDQHAVDEDAAGVSHHPCRDEARAGVGDERQLSLQSGVLGLQPPGQLLPLAKPLILLQQKVVLGVDLDHPPDLFDEAVDRRRRGAEYFQDWRCNVDDGHARTLDDHRLGLAEQHQAEGESDEQQERKAMGPYPKREGKSQPRCCPNLASNGVTPSARPVFPSIHANEDVFQFLKLLERAPGAERHTG